MNLKVRLEKIEARESPPLDIAEMLIQARKRHLAGESSPPIDEEAFAQSELGRSILAARKRAGLAW